MAHRSSYLLLALLTHPLAACTEDDANGRVTDQDSGHERDGRDAAMSDTDAATDDECGLLRVIDDFTASTQAELDAMTCVREVNHTITLSGSEITDLSPLRRLARVGGLRLTGLTRLETLSGLENLRAVGDRGLYVTHNPRLRDLRGLEQLWQVGWELEITDNESLTTLEGLGALTTLISPDDGNPRGYLIVRENPQLTSLAALEKLHYVQSGFHICGNPMLTSLFESESPIENSGLRLSVLYNAALPAEAGVALRARLALDYTKIAANRPGPHTPGAACAHRGDGICDESTYVSGDEVQECKQSPCCELAGPTWLCVDGSDDPEDCPQDGFLPY